MSRTQDPELRRFQSGTRRFASPPAPSLAQALDHLDKARRGKPYRRTKKQMDDAKRVSDRIMGERDA
jgi:hypothetical protein